MAIVRVIQENVLGCQRVAFDSHAEARMTERGVTEDEVLAVLRNPDQTGLPTLRHRLRYRKEVAPGRLVDVVFELDPTEVVVFSVWAH
jgi:hypothetical protein